jgi:hypothetical protein
MRQGSDRTNVALRSRGFGSSRSLGSKGCLGSVSALSRPSRPLSRPLSRRRLSRPLSRPFSRPSVSRPLSRPLSRSSRPLSRRLSNPLCRRRQSQHRFEAGQNDCFQAAGSDAGTMLEHADEPCISAYALATGSPSCSTASFFLAVCQSAQAPSQSGDKARYGHCRAKCRFSGMSVHADCAGYDSVGRVQALAEDQAW